MVHVMELAGDPVYHVLAHVPRVLVRAHHAQVRVGVRVGVRAQDLFIIGNLNPKSIMGYNNANDTMKKENNELQSRREFFKKAAKGALPILGAVILASSPIISKAVEKETLDCNGSCYRSCYYGCDMTCMGTCKTTCQNTCEGTCKGSCLGGCTGSCSGGCSGSSYF